MLIVKTCQGQDVKWGQLDTFELKQYLKKIDNETIQIDDDNEEE